MVQARAYAELEKRAGSFSGAPDDGYAVPEVEGLDAGVLNNNPMVEWFKQVATETNLNQDTFNKIISGYLATEQEMVTYNRLAEMSALGDNAKQRLTDLGDWHAILMPRLLALQTPQKSCGRCVMPRQNRAIFECPSIPNTKSRWTRLMNRPMGAPYNWLIER